MNETTRMTGRITRLIHAKGYGFIEGPNGEERFLHARDLVDTADWPNLREGQTLDFEPVERKNGGRNGLGCTEVRLTENVHGNG